MPTTDRPDDVPWGATISAAPLVEPQTLAPAGSRLLVVSVHADDETIGAGRLVSAWARTVGPVSGLLLSDGASCDIAQASASTPGRRDEWESAVSDLGGRPLGCAALPDDEVAPNLRLVEEVVETLAAAHDAIAAPWGGDPHPDHVTAGRAIAVAAARVGVPVISYPVWMTYWFPPAAVLAPVVRLATAEEDESTRALAMSRYAAGADAPRALGRSRHFLDHHTEQLLVGVA